MSDIEKRSRSGILSRLASRDAAVREGAERELAAMGPDGAEVLVGAVRETKAEVAKRFLVWSLPAILAGVAAGLIVEWIAGQAAGRAVVMLPFCALCRATMTCASAAS